MEKKNHNLAAPDAFGHVFCADCGLPESMLDGNGGHCDPEALATPHVVYEDEETGQ